MEGSVSGLFMDGVQVDSAIGGLRADGIESARHAGLAEPWRGVADAGADAGVDGAKLQSREPAGVIARGDEHLDRVAADIDDGD